MASSINAANPIAGNPTTQSVRDNFAAAKSEIEALQAADALLAPIASPTFTGTATIPTATITSLTVNGTPFDPANYATTASLSGYAPLTGAVFTGSVTVPTLVLGATTITATGTEINYLDVTTLGTVQANKAVTAAASAINFNNFDMLNVDINSGAIDGTNIGAASPGTGAFTTLTSTAGTVADSTKWDGNSISIVATLPGTPDANTIYFVTG